MQRAGAAIEQDAEIAALDPVTGGGARADGATVPVPTVTSSILTFPRKTIRLNTSKPGALSLARYTPAGNGCPSSARPSHISRGSQMPPLPEPRP